MLFQFGNGTTASLYFHSPTNHKVGQLTTPQLANACIHQFITQPFAYHLTEDIDAPDIFSEAFIVNSILLLSES
jgi:hypothetical protein